MIPVLVHGFFVGSERRRRGLGWWELWHGGAGGGNSRVSTLSVVPVTIKMSPAGRRASREGPSTSQSVLSRTEQSTSHRSPFDSEHLKVA